RKPRQTVIEVRGKTSNPPVGCNGKRAATSRNIKSGQALHLAQGRDTAAMHVLCEGGSPGCTSELEGQELESQCDSPHGWQPPS
ncbi:Hypothetical predicted protein, partial [Pelobates cultripes]